MGILATLIDVGWEWRIRERLKGEERLQGRHGPYYNSRIPEGPKHAAPIADIIFS